MESQNLPNRKNASRQPKECLKTSQTARSLNTKADGYHILRSRIPTTIHLLGSVITITPLVWRHRTQRSRCSSPLQNVVSSSRPASVRAERGTRRRFSPREPMAPPSPTGKNGGKTFKKSILQVRTKNSRPPKAEARRLELSDVVCN